MKLLCYLASSLLALAVGEGAIIYREVLIQGEIFDNVGGVLFNNIDLDQDGEIDFFTTSQGGEASLVPTGDNRVLGVPATGLDLGAYGVGLPSNYEIDFNTPQGLVWRGLDDRINQFDPGGVSLFMCNGRGPVGEPPICITSLSRVNSSFVGLEFLQDGETHYGWVEIAPRFRLNHHARVVSWAYESEPGVPIMAGAIPEPSSVLLTLLGVPFLLRRRR